MWQKEQQKEFRCTNPLSADAFTTTAKCGDASVIQVSAARFAAAATDARACRDGASLVFMASYGGHVSCVEALIRAKADVLQCAK
jgi:hypothetical protein